MSQSPPTLPRRHFLALGGVAAGAAMLGAEPASASADVADDRITLPGYAFTLGVASGDPLPDGVVLWTRLAPDPLALDGLGGMPERAVNVRWEVAEDEKFHRVVRRGVERATAAYRQRRESEIPRSARWAAPVRHRVRTRPCGR